MAKAPPSIAATSTLAMVRTAAARGIDTGAVLAAAGIRPDQLEDPDARLPGTTVLSIWSTLRERAGDPALQLTAPCTLPYGAYHVIEYLIAASATVGHAVDRFARFFRLIADGVSLTVEHAGPEHCLKLEMADGRPVPPVYVDYVFAALVGRVRMRIKPDLRVLRVELRQPDPASAATYESVFRAPVRFGAAGDRLWFSDEEWRAPMETSDETLARVLEEHARTLAQRLPQVAAGFPVQVQRTIAEVLPEGGSAVEVARRLHCSVRTLQRKLIASGTTFRELQERVRGQLAQEYLRDRNVSIAEVAFMLGFSDQSSFNRTFRRWTGETPGRWRRQRA